MNFDPVQVRAHAGSLCFRELADFCADLLDVITNTAAVRIVIRGQFVPFKLGAIRHADTNPVLAGGAAPYHQHNTMVRVVFVGQQHRQFGPAADTDPAKLHDVFGNQMLGVRTRMPVRAGAPQLLSDYVIRGVRTIMLACLGDAVMHGVINRHNFRPGLVQIFPVTGLLSLHPIRPARRVEHRRIKIATVVTVGFFLLLCRLYGDIRNRRDQTDNLKYQCTFSGHRCHSFRLDTSGQHNGAPKPRGDPEHWH